MALFYSFALAVVFALIIYGIPEIAGPIAFLALLVLWIAWRYGMKAFVNVYEDHIDIQGAVRKYSIPWSEVRDIRYRVHIEFVMENGKVMKSYLYPSTWQDRLIWSRTKAGGGRKILEQAVSKSFNDFEHHGAEEKTWPTIKYVPPSLQFMSAALGVGIAVEIIEIVVLHH